MITMVIYLYKILLNMLQCVHMIFVSFEKEEEEKKIKTNMFNVMFTLTTITICYPVQNPNIISLFDESIALNSQENCAL